MLAPVAAAAYAYRRYLDAVAVRVELARISLLDNLTGLPNRLFLSEWLDDELRRTRRAEDHLAVMFIDLDRFKLINDTHGHDIGDAVLVTLASRIRRCLDEDCKLVRYAGDEFLAFCREDTLTPRAERIALRVREALKEPVRIGTDVLRVDASIGIAHHQDGDSADELIRKADLAMYDAKARQDGLPVKFDPTRHGDRLSPATLEPMLRHAVHQHQFRLVYQPVTEIVTGEMVAVETLLRWDHPTRGPVPPSEFIPVLEESGLIVGVGEWIIDEAFRQAHEWHRAFPDQVPLRVAVNVSARQLAQSGFDDKVRQALTVHPVPPAAICLEITEGALMVDIEAAWSALRVLKRLGVKLALDDFGTGYSSLSYIRTFSLDMLKIDKSFVDGLGESPEDTAIVEHVIGMARALGKHLLQRDALRQRRQVFVAAGARATDHGHASADTSRLPDHEAARLFEQIHLALAQVAEELVAYSRCVSLYPNQKHETPADHFPMGWPKLDAIERGAVETARALGVDAPFMSYVPQRIASWQTGAFPASGDKVDHRIDVTGHITRSGVYLVSFDYTRGLESLQIERVALIARPAAASRKSPWMFTTAAPALRISSTNTSSACRNTIRRFATHCWPAWGSAQARQTHRIAPARATSTGAR